MFPKKFNIVFNQVATESSGTGANSQPPPPPSAPPAKASVEYDELGYAKPPVEAAPVQANTPPPPAAPNADVSSGYDAAPPPPDTAGYVEPTPPPATPPANQFKVEVDLKEFNEVDKKLFTESFEKYKLPKEAQQALVDIRKTYLAQQAAEQSNQQKQVEAQVSKLKSDWFNELKNDKDFGGTNFDVNVKMVNKFIQDFLPNTKKMLTEKGGMLPPNTMRDFHSVAKKLYETEGFVQGDGSSASEAKPNDHWKFLSDMYPGNN